jgi:hypothetical protein
MNQLDHTSLELLIKRYNKKAYDNSKRWEKYVWVFSITDEWGLLLNRWVVCKRWLIWDIWIPVPITTEIYNFLYNF